MNDWKVDKKWSDQFIPEMKAILGYYLVGEAAQDEDAERNTDLMVYKMETARIGCRVRTREYMERYGDEFTIRSGRPSGVKTELAKIIEGWGDYFFYGFASVTPGHLEKWFLGDMKVFRLWFMREMARCGGSIPGMAQHNRDGSSKFVAFTISDLPKEFVVGSSDDFPFLLTPKT